MKAHTFSRNEVADRLEWAAELACILEASADKPGNVTPHSDFADTGFTDFILSALAIGPVLRRAFHSSVGGLIRECVSATRAVAAGNTNLGIILLLAPLARAYAVAAPDDAAALEQTVAQVLERLTLDDARLAYSAIREAVPGGLGRAAEHDVAEEPAVTLLEAMRSAADRDSIAREYATGFSVTFGVGYPTLLAALAEYPDPRQATVHTFLRLLAAVPDTLIARKLGAAEALEASAAAGEVLAAGGLRTAAGRRELSSLDRRLRDPGHRRNPGTTADLTAAALFTALLLHGPALLRRPRGYLPPAR